MPSTALWELVKKLYGKRHIIFGSFTSEQAVYELPHHFWFFNRSIIRITTSVLVLSPVSIIRTATSFLALSPVSIIRIATSFLAQSFTGKHYTNCHISFGSFSSEHYTNCYIIFGSFITGKHYTNCHTIFGSVFHRQALYELPHHYIWLSLSPVSIIRIATSVLVLSPVSITRIAT